MLSRLLSTSENHCLIRKNVPQDFLSQPALPWQEHGLAKFKIAKRICSTDTNKTQILASDMMPIGSTKRIMNSILSCCYKQYWWLYITLQVRLSICRSGRGLQGFKQVIRVFLLEFFFHTAKFSKYNDIIFWRVSFLTSCTK